VIIPVEEHLSPSDLREEFSETGDRERRRRRGRE
jgi:hypothetical protein